MIARLLVPLMLLPLVSPASPSDSARSVSEIRPGDLELGCSASLIQVEQSLRVTASLQAGIFGRWFEGLLGGEIAARYRHVAALDELDLLVGATWQPQLPAIPLYPYAGVLAGLRQEWVGSYRAARFPAGIQSGVRIVVQDGVLIRCGIQALRILNDPVQDFTEWELVVGVAMLLDTANSAADKRNHP